MKNPYQELVDIVGSADALRIVAHLTEKLNTAIQDPRFVTTDNPEPKLQGVVRYAGWLTLRKICLFCGSKGLSFVGVSQHEGGWSDIYEKLETIAKQQVEAKLGAVESKY